MNRILSGNEIRALKEGSEVFVEERTFEFFSGISKKRGSELVDSRGGGYNLNTPGWNTYEGHVDVRVWELPQPPTPEEQAANPWPEATT